MATSISGGGDISVNGAPSISLPSSGLVLTPQHRYGFIAARTTNQSLVGANVVPIFDTFVYNVGNLYNNTTGVITAPVTGVYDINMRILTNNANNNIDLRIYVNGVNTKLASYSGNWSGHKALILNITYLLNAGDTMDFRTLSTSDASMLGQTTDYHSNLCVHFLG